METNIREQKVELVADEIKLYLEHLNLIAGITGKQTGDATSYSAFSFGKPTKVEYQLDEEGNMLANLDFSTINWDWNNDENFHADVDLDHEEHGYEIYTDWMRNHSGEFSRNINLGLVDFDAVKECLNEKYGIDFSLSYDEKTYSKTHVNGSEDYVSENRCVYYKVDSQMYLKGKVQRLDYVQSEGYQRGR